MRFTLRVASTIPLELHGITPERVANLSAAEVAKLPVQHGNRAEPLGEFFDVSTRVTVRPTRPDLQFSGDTRTVHGIGAGMTGGFIYVENSAGRHAGAEMVGGQLIIESGAGDWLGAEMRGGFIEVRGRAGDQAGAAYRGSRRGMTGGVILLRSGAGDEVGLLMRRGLIVSDGPVGEFAGASMIAGSLILLGGAGGRLGAGMKRGTVVTAGEEPRLPPGFRFACEYRPAFLGIYQRSLAAMRHVTLRSGETVRCHRGDVAAGGRGEILHVAT